MDYNGPMPAILTDVPLDAAALWASVPSLTLRQLLPHAVDWELEERLLAGVEILLCKRPPLNFDRMPDLRLIQLSTVGYEHLRHLGLGERPLRVCNARGVFDTAIAEWNLAMMIALTRDLRAMIRHQERAAWVKAPGYQQEIRGRTVGLWGYGGIGRETARLAKAFGLRVHVLTRSGVRPRLNAYAQPGTGDPDGTLPDRVFVAGQELEFLAGLDFLILALPQTRQSEARIGVRELQALPRSAFVLNPARGPIIQEPALLQALREGWIAGAALDTHFAYPLPAEHPLWAMPNVILTPHVSGADQSRDFPARMADLFVQNVRRYREGRPLLNELTPQEWQEA